jgi:hypothetical protein
LARFLLAVTFGLANGFNVVCAIFLVAAFVAGAFFAGLTLGF